MRCLRIHGASWDSVFLTVGKLLTMLFSIISAKMMSEGLSLSEYGTYSQANMISSVGTSLILLGLVDALLYYFSGKQKEIDNQQRNRIVNTVFFLELLIGLVLAVLLLLGQELLVDYFENPAVRSLLPIVAFLPMLSNLIYFYQVLYVGAGKAKMMSVYSVIMILIRIVSIYFAVYVLENLLLIFIVLILQDIVQIFLYNHTLANSGIKINPFKISTAHIGRIFAYGLPMGIYAVTSSLNREIGKIVVDRLAGTEELAIYTNCAKMLPVDILVSSFALVLVPHIIRHVTEKNRERSLALFSNYLKVGYYSVWILGAMLLITPQTVISFLYDDKYLPGTMIFVLYVFDSMLRFASMHQVLVASNKTKLLMLYSAGSLILNLVLSVLLYHLLGLMGPAIASLLSAFAYTWLVLRKSMKLMDAKFTDMFDLKEIGWLLLSIGILWAVCSFLYERLVSSGVHMYIAMIASMALFGCSALAIHFKKIAKILKEINTFRI